MVFDFFILDILLILNTTNLCFLFSSIQSCARFLVHLSFLLHIRLYKLTVILYILRSKILFSESLRLGFFKSVFCWPCLFSFGMVDFFLRILIGRFWSLRLIVCFLWIAAIIVFTWKHKTWWLNTIIYLIIFIIIIVFFMPQEMIKVRLVHLLIIY